MDSSETSLLRILILFMMNLGQALDMIWNMTRFIAHNL